MENKKSKFDIVLDRCEAIGNKLPDPVSIFVILCAILLLVSVICSKAGIEAVNPVTNEVIQAKNLLERENLQTFIKKMTTVFQSFPPLGVVLVSLLGIGLADKTGLLGSFLKIVVTKVNKSFIYIAIVTMGIVFFRNR